MGRGTQSPWQQQARDPLCCVPQQHKPPGEGQRQPSPDRSTVPSESDEFSSFLYWRAPLPNIEEELQELLVGPGASCPHCPCCPAPDRERSMSCT